MTVATELRELDFRLVVEQSDVGLCVTRDGRFEYVNPKFAEMHGCTEQALLGADLLQVVHESERARVKEIRRLRDIGQHHAPYESRNVRADGTTFDSRIYGRAISFRGGPANLTTISDISELTQAHRLAAWRARMLVSTELLCGSGSVEIDLSGRHILASAGTRKMLGVDESFSATGLRTALRRVHPGDRRRVIGIWRAARPGQAFELTHRLVRADGSVLRVLHRGLIELVEGDESLRPVAILQDVTEQARDTGTAAARRLRLEGALRRAFERDELTLAYQPQVDLRKGHVVGVEALLRWQSAEFGAVSPGEFVPIAEEIGLIVGIGEWVFRTACLQSVAWAKAGLRPVRIGVNLSPLQLEQPDISRRLQSIMLETGADPRHLGIEVTESVLTRDLEQARRTLDELSAIGVEVALDDFGTGYSNLSVLRALPFDVLKIDRSLVHDVTAAPQDVSITRAVLTLAQALKIKVLAEGVETEGQLNLLMSNGCDLMQGYIFSKPVSAAEVEQMLRTDRRLPEQYTQRMDRRRTLLLVDDEEGVLASLRRLLRGNGYHIVTARSGEEGLARLAEFPVDVIVSDQRMPGMTGVEFLRRTKELYPETVRIVLSGYTEFQSITDAVNEGAIYKFLTKPWDDELLRAHVAEAFRRKELADDNRRLAAEVSCANQQLALANEQLEKTLARQREQLSLEEVRALNAQDLLENLPTPIIGIDADGTIAFVNRAARVLIRSAPMLVGCAAADVLPPDWVQAWKDSDGQHRPSRVSGRPCLLSCAPMTDRGPARGHLLSVIPTHEHTEETSS